MVDDLAHARDEISALHQAAEEHVKQLEELDRLKSQFLSMASHELKTPLTSISGFLQLAHRRARRRLSTGYPTEAEWREEQEGHVDHLEMINAQTFRLARLVDELLDVSRIESGQLELRLTDVDVRQVVSEAVARMQHTTTQHQIRLDAPAEDEAVIQGDRDYLEQVFTNLIGNAIKYSPDGGRIGVGVRRQRNQVVIRVSDQGVGIPQDEIDTIFSLFYRSRDATARQAGGMGLGLYISKEFVSRHGGRIWADSVPSKGSTFHVSLPVMSAAQAPTAGQVAVVSR